MCRNIKLLFNFNPPVNNAEVQAASHQFVRKITGFNKPSKANEQAFQAAVDAIAAISYDLLASLETNAPPKSREEEAAKARARNAIRFPPDLALLPSRPSHALEARQSARESPPIVSLPTLSPGTSPSS